MSCDRPSNSSASAREPSSVSKRYSFSSCTQGSSRRCRAISSPSRVCSFSRASSASRAASHSSRVPVLWFIRSPFAWLDRDDDSKGDERERQRHVEGCSRRQQLLGEDDEGDDG